MHEIRRAARESLLAYPSESAMLFDGKQMQVDRILYWKDCCVDMLALNFWSVASKVVSN